MMLRKNQVLTIGKRRYKVLYVNATGPTLCHLRNRSSLLGRRRSPSSRGGWSSPPTVNRNSPRNRHRERTDQ